MEQTTTSVIKSEPKEVFAHLFGIITLLASTGSLFGLLSALITLQFSSANTYPGMENSLNYGIRTAISFLVVSFGLYIWIMRLIGSWEKADPERTRIRIRKWMVYLTIFLAGAALAGDSVAVLNSFLQGDLTTAFLLKALSLAVIAGLVFSWYRAYAAEVRPRWAATVGWAGIGLVSLSLIVGFIVAGSPLKQREIATDLRRVNDLLSIQNAVIRYWQSKNQIPASLADLYSAGNSQLFGNEPMDPVRNSPYEYKVNGPLSFELCATFSRPAKAYTTANPYDRSGAIGRHGAGYQCFPLTIDPQLYKPDYGGRVIP